RVLDAPDAMAGLPVAKLIEKGSVTTTSTVSAVVSWPGDAAGLDASDSPPPHATANTVLAANTARKTLRRLLRRRNAVKNGRGKDNTLVVAPDSASWNICQWSPWSKT
ncbi:MAG: hypothetical protein IIC30_05425, partial [Chloroflexi bacterium]|nr:hypothetical protein [Chloroflexota bacterium]